MSRLPTRGCDRFARLVRQPGGITVDEAVSASNANLESIRDDIVAEIDTALERMNEIAVALKSGPVGTSLAELYNFANTVAGMAGVCGMNCLGQAALSFCELIDQMKERRKWDYPAVEVHASALRYLRRDTEANLSVQTAIVEKLRQLVIKV